MRLPKERAQVKRFIRSNTTLHTTARTARNVVILSLLLEPFLFVSVPVPKLPAPEELPTLSSFWAICVLFGALVWQWPALSGRFLLNSKTRLEWVLFIPLVLLVLLPFGEVVFRLSSLNSGIISITLLLLVVPFTIGIINLFRGGVSPLPPRNRFLHIERVDRNLLLFFCFGLLAARGAVSVGTLLFLASLIDSVQYLAATGVSLLLLFSLQPQLRRFYSRCPSCQALRSRALASLSTCPGCEKRSFISNRVIYPAAPRAP